LASRKGLAIDGDLWRRLERQAAVVREKAVEPLRELRRRIWKDEARDVELRAPIKRLLLCAELRADLAAYADGPIDDGLEQFIAVVREAV
jgi:hypothetical protein